MTREDPRRLAQSSAAKDILKDDDMNFHPHNPHEHQHRFTIPVEWEYQWSVEGMGVGTHPVGEHPGRKVVMRLMCECGEEKDR